MTEKINGQGFRPADAAGTRRADAAKPAGAKTETSALSSASSGDTVNLTPSGLLLSKLEDALQSVPVVDSQRVRAIKEALASGSYEIDDQAVADRMIRLERELLG
ncbi:MAG TPA: flagellar biosynthesis anti-sigma factor FlgM [Gammaproteobacteria bacterium]|nr:flagellar biosynthesis anti-sigma factor FlgM [Gammaproteobacteria bacterium]